MFNHLPSWFAKAGQPRSKFIDSFTGVCPAWLQNSREKLRSGEFVAEGRYANFRENLSGPAKTYCAFDIDKKLWRFDQICPAIVFTHRRGKQPEGFEIKNDAGGKLVLMPDRMIYWENGSRLVSIDNPKFAIPHWIQPWDVRSIGMLTIIGYMQAVKFDKVYSAFAKRDVNAKSSRMTRLNKNILRWEMIEKTNHVIVDFDESKGYVPIRYWAGDSPDRRAPNTMPQHWSEVEYEQHGEIWLPKRFWISPYGKPGSDYGYEFTLTWSKVNEPIEPEKFMTRGMAIDEGTNILARAADGATLQLGKIGDLDPHPKLLKLEPQPPPEPWAWWVWTLIGVGVVGVLAIGIWVGRSQQRRAI